MSYTDDPIRDFERHDREQQEWLDSRPVCDGCFDPIQDDFYYDIYGQKICEDCLMQYFRKAVEE